MTNETQDKQQAASEVRDVYEEASHVLPPFVNWLIDNALLPLLLIAEGYLMGSLFVRGWVSDIEQPLN
jgi:hypothetical protein